MALNKKQANQKYHASIVLGKTADGALQLPFKCSSGQYFCVRIMHHSSIISYIVSSYTSVTCLENGILKHFPFYTISCYTVHKTKKHAVTACILFQYFTLLPFKFVRVCAVLHVPYQIVYYQLVLKNDT